VQRQVPSKTVDHLTCAEPDLVESARQGNEEAFRVIIMRHNRRLYRTALAIVGIPSEAEDVVQECFVRAFTNLAQFRGDSSLATWLTRIAVNEALGRRRRCRGTLDLAVVENRQASDAQIRYRSSTAILSARSRSIKSTRFWNGRLKTFPRDSEAFWLPA